MCLTLRSIALVAFLLGLSACSETSAAPPTPSGSLCPSVPPASGSQCGGGSQYACSYIACGLAENCYCSSDHPPWICVGGSPCTPSTTQHDCEIIYLDAGCDGGDAGR